MVRNLPRCRPAAYDGDEPTWCILPAKERKRPWQQRKREQQQKQQKMKQQ